MKRLLITCSLVLIMAVSASVANATPIHPARRVVGKTVTTTVTTTTTSIRSTIKGLREHLKNHGPLRGLRGTIRGLFNMDVTPDPDVKEVAE